MSLYDEFFKIAECKQKFHYFYHPHNCGFPPGATTERVIEMPIADLWLSSTTNVVEVGAVSPYYWPGRIKYIIDPFDGHPYVTHKISIFDADLRGQNVLSISTLEHIGMPFYGQAESENNGVVALQKIISECNSFLITFGAGIQRALDDVVYFGNVDSYCKVRFMIRTPDERWIIEKNKDKAWRQFGPWANSVAILEKGDTLK